MLGRGSKSDLVVISLSSSLPAHRRHALHLLDLWPPGAGLSYPSEFALGTLAAGSLILLCSVKGTAFLP